MYKMKIMNKCLLIAEIGINHNGDLNLARDSFKKQNSGFDAVNSKKRY